MPYLCFVRTKYYIEIDGIKSEVPGGCLKNWDEIQCVYKRSDFSGVTRSFTSQFEFVGEMHDKLMALYLRDGVNAHAVLSLYTITNEWAWVERFSCELDFSSITWNGYIVKINCIDDSLASLIKANKGTKYEAVVDTDIASDRRFTFNRLPIKNSITYEYTGGESDEDDGSLTIGPASNKRVYMGIVNSEDVYLNGAVTWEEDQTEDAGSYMLKALKDVQVTVNVDLTTDQCHPFNMRSYFVVIGSDGTEKTVADSQFTLGGTKTYLGDYISENSLNEAHPPSSLTANVQYWATVRDHVWEYSASIHETSTWQNTGMTEDEYRRRKTSRQLTVNLAAEEKLAIATEGSGACIYSSSFALSWFCKGEPITTSAFSPRRVGQYLLNKMCVGKINAVLAISDYDSRLAKTLVLAAESIRGIDGDKLYTSFSDFTTWMETVFGYTYYIGGVVENKFKSHQKAHGGIIYDEITPEVEAIVTAGGFPAEDIVYLQALGKFAVLAESKYYTDFTGAAVYNDAVTGKARTDTVFSIRRYGEHFDECYFTYKADGAFNAEPIIYELNVDDIGKRCQEVVFLHRSELFNADAKVRQIRGAKEIEYSVDNGVIYSSVNIGYDKKDYQNINGRDEFNFNSTYTTGCTLGDKKLSMISKYRADCYGIEFAAQHRGKDTTDSTSDNDVFFVYCNTSGNSWTPDTTANIENAISDDVFNGAFSPLECIDANAGFIGIQGTPMKLTFASSAGNSGIVIDNRPMNADITLASSMVTCGVLAFSSSEIDEEIGLDDMFEVHSNGVTYRGFLQEASFKYAKAETVKYKLIVKEIEL